MRIYVSVPINGRKEATFSEKKIAAKQQADAIKLSLESEGHEAITPFDVVPIDEEVSDAEALGRCITAERGCDSVYFGSGWRHSSGCRVERYTASEYAIGTYKDEL